MDEVQLGAPITRIIEDRVDAVVERLLTPLMQKLEKKSDLPAQEWFSIRQTARLTGLSEDHVRRHVTAGLLPVVNQGTYDKPLYRIHRRDIDDWMAKRREAPHPAPRKKNGKPTGSYVSRHHKTGAA